MYKDEIEESLKYATNLVLELLKGKINITEFMNRYNNFYYYEALDGHEANTEQKQILREFENEIEFHRKVQTEVLDLIFFDDNKQIYLNSGRIDCDEAIRRLNKLKREFVCD